MKKLLRIFLTICVCFVALIFFLIYVVIPLGVPWAVRSQAARILKHPVQLRSFWLNPFLMRVSVGGLKILDKDNGQVMVGFEKFWVDASFLSLLKKKYRVEIVGLDGLVVNTALLSGNRINLLDVMPPQGKPQEQQEPPRGETAPPRQGPSTPPGAPQALPEIVVDSIRLINGTVTFSDYTVTPRFMTSLTAMDLNITAFSTRPDAATHAVFSSKLDKKGSISVDAVIKPFANPIEMETSFSLNDYALTVLTPYVGKYTGRAVKEGGKLDLNMEYRISDNKLDARHKLLIQKFDFGQKVSSKDALPLPFGLVVALLEDPQGRITVSLPVEGDMSNPKFAYWPLLGQVATNFVMKLVTSPFTSLLSMAGLEAGSEEYGKVTFDPGSAVLTDKTKEKLTLLVKALRERPKISLEINGSYDPAADWKAMKTAAYKDEFARRYVESTGDELSITEQMYTLRFGKRAYWALVRTYTSGEKIDAAGLGEEMRRLIIEQGAPDLGALETLAGERAQGVYDVLVAAGCDVSRVSVGVIKPVQESMGQIPLEFTLTVHGIEEDDGTPSEG